MIHRFFPALIFLAGVFCNGGAEAKLYPDWEGFSPFYSMNGVIEFQGKVYGTSKGGIFRYDPETREYTLFYKGYGLESNTAQCVAATSEYLYFGFETAGLLRFDPRTDTFEPILFPEYVPSHVGVRAIFAKSDSILYVGHSQGVDMLNLVTNEVRTCNRLGKLPENTPVNDVQAFKGKIWVCTPNGLAVIDENNPNLELDNAWKSYTYTYFEKTTGFYCIMRMKDEAEDVIYVGTHDQGIIQFDDVEEKFWPTAVTADRIRVYKMTAGMGKFWAASNAGLYYKYVRFWSWKTSDFTNITAVWGTEDRVWVATEQNGLQCYTEKGYVDVAPAPGPRSTRFTKIDIAADGTVWTCFGDRDRVIGVVQRLQNGIWSIYNKGAKDVLFHPNSISLDRKNNLLVGVWGDKYGMYVIENNGDAGSDTLLVPLDPTREVIKETIKREWEACPDVTQDSRGNIWVANLQLDPDDTESGGAKHNLEPIPTSGAVVLDGYPIKKYRHFSPSSGDISTAKIFKICADDDGWVWMGTLTQGLMAVRYGDDPYDTAQPTVKHHLMTADGLYSLRVTAIHHDKDGYVWVGSEAGLNRITKLSDYSLKVDTMNQLLLTAGTEILSIEVDRLNNKWIGTVNGLVKINAMNETTAVYTTENSGLFSNSIYSLKYDDSRDVLWVGTDAGLNKFNVFGKKTAETGRLIRVYPNPFSIWGTDSRCTFDNLMLGRKLRIYTFSGDIVNELEVKDVSDKGIPYVTWNGRNFKNEPVASGVYFFTGMDKSENSFRDKMVIIRR